MYVKFLQTQITGEKMNINENYQHVWSHPVSSVGRNVLALWHNVANTVNDVWVFPPNAACAVAFSSQLARKGFECAVTCMILQCPLQEKGECTFASPYINETFTVSNIPFRSYATRRLCFHTCWLVCFSVCQQGYTKGYDWQWRDLNSKSRHTKPQGEKWSHN